MGCTQRKYEKEEDMTLVISIIKLLIVTLVGNEKGLKS